MKIKYKISDINYAITFCKKKETPDIANSLKENYSDKKILVLLDQNLKESFLKYLKKDLQKIESKIYFLKIKANKNNKNLKTMLKIIDFLIKKKFTKKSVVISCGGGVVGDTSALASSLYLRGLIYYHIPTTMTAIVDSCIGGKTGINYKNIINSLGSYYHPKNVFISKNVISLIPKREFFSGIPEIIKCGCIDNFRIIRLLEKNKKKFTLRNYDLIKRLIFKTLKTKIKFFKNDVFENDKRLLLNFGHTFAHAIEMSLRSNKNDIIRHGEAVGLGLLCEIFYFENKSKNYYLVEKLLKEYGLPTNLKNFFKIKNKLTIVDNIYRNVFLDKKRITRYPRIVKLKKIGQSSLEEMRDFNRIKYTIKNVLL